MFLVTILIMLSILFVIPTRDFLTKEFSKLEDMILDTECVIKVIDDKIKRNINERGDLINPYNFIKFNISNIYFLFKLKKYKKKEMKLYREIDNYC